MGDSKEEELSPLQKMKQRSMYLNSRLYGGYYDQQWKTLNQEEYQEIPEEERDHSGVSYGLQKNRYSDYLEASARAHNIERAMRDRT